jgi:hypothetical protein
MAEYEKRDSFKVTLFVQMRLDSFTPDQLRVVGFTHQPLLSDHWLLLGQKEIDLVELGFDIPTPEAIQQLVADWQQRRNEKERKILMDKLKDLENLPTDAYEQTDSFHKN